MSNSVNFTINVNGNATAQVNSINSAVNNATQSVRGLADKFNGIGKFALSFNMVRSAIQSVASVVGSATDAYNLQAEYETKLTTVMRQRIGATDEQIDEIKNLA